MRAEAVTLEAVILVAGVGARIHELTGGGSKCFLEVAGETLIERSLRLLRAQGVERITLVTGFMEPAFRAACPGCRFVSNPDYERTNTGVSLALALADALARPADADRRILVLNGDVYCDESVIAGVLSSPAGASLAAIKRHPLGDEEVKVFVDDGRVIEIGKHLDCDRAHAEAFGVYLLSAWFAAALLRELADRRDPGQFYEAGMDRLLSAGHVLHAHDVGEAVVQEIDFPGDYVALLERLSR